MQLSIPVSLGLAALVALPFGMQQPGRRAGDQPGRALAPAFDPDGWMTRLTDPDLERREHELDLLLQRATREPELRHWIEERSRDAGNPDLAWTCRMASRLLASDRGSDQFGWRDWQRSGPGLPRGFDLDGLFGDLGRLQGEIQEQMRELERQFGDGGRFHWGPAPPAPPVPQAPRAGARHESRSVQIHSGPDGTVVRVTTDEDGEERTQEYRAETLDEILEQHPELRDLIGGGSSGSGGRGLRLQFGEPDRWRADEPWGEPAPLPLPRPNASPRTDILGIHFVEIGEGDAIRSRLGLEPGVGVYVEGTEPGTIARRIGLRQGDVLIELNGRAIRSADDIRSILAERAPDRAVTAVWYDASGGRRERTWRPGGASQDRDGG